MVASSQSGTVASIHAELVQLLQDNASLHHRLEFRWRDMEYGTPPEFAEGGFESVLRVADGHLEFSVVVGFDTTECLNSQRNPPRRITAMMKIRI